MAVTVQMSNDIRKFQTKTIGMFTSRQIIFCIVAVAISVPVALLLPLSRDDKIMTGVFIATPLLACGCIPDIEVFLLRYVYTKYLTPRKRQYKRVNVFKEQLKKQDILEEKAMLASMNSAQRSKYNAIKKRKATVKYSEKPAYKIYR